MNLRYRVELSQTERAELTALLSGGKHAARKLKRAPPPVPTHQQGGRVGRWSFWRRARIEQVVGKLKRFKRAALRCR